MEACIQSYSSVRVFYRGSYVASKNYNLSGTQPFTTEGGRIVLSEENGSSTTIIIPPLSGREQERSGMLSWADGNDKLSALCEWNW